MKPLIILFLIIYSSMAFAKEKEYVKFCKKGASLGQKFLQSSSKKDLELITNDCIASPKVKEVLSKINKDEVKIFACGSGVGLALFFYKQDSLLKSPRAFKVMEKCYTK